MKYKLTFALVAALTSTAFAAFQAPLPEFKNEKQLAEWRAEKASEATRQGYVAEETAFYTGKPYLASSGGYAFKYRNYNPEVARWTSEDPSGFPDGANQCNYAPTPTSSIDFMGLRKLSLLGNLEAGNNLEINNQIGTVNVVRYKKLVDMLTFGADISLNTTISSDNGKIYRWMQHVTITDQDGNFLDWHGSAANNLMDPYPNGDTKDWYYSNGERATRTTSNGGEKFADSPGLLWSRLNSTVKEITVSFDLKLIQLDDLEVVTGGNAVFTTSWGFKISE